MSEQTPQAPLPYEVYRAEQYAKAQAEASQMKMDETDPGGRYLAPDGTPLDANGNPINKGDVNLSPTGSHASLAADPAVVYPDLLKQARAEVMREMADQAARDRLAAEAEVESAKAQQEAAAQTAKTALQAAKTAERKG